MDSGRLWIFYSGWDGGGGQAGGRSCARQAIRESRTPGRRERKWNLPSRVTSTRPAVSSSLMWWERVAGAMASAGPRTEQPIGQDDLAILSSSSNRLGSARALRIPVRRARVRRTGLAEVAAGEDSAVMRRSCTVWMQWYRNSGWRSVVE